MAQATIGIRNIVALGYAEAVGLALPCNVIVYEHGDGRCVIAAVDPDAMLSVIGDNR